MNKKRKKNNKDDDKEGKEKEESNKDNNNKEEEKKENNKDNSCEEKKKDTNVEGDNRGEDESGCKSQEIYEAAVRELGAVNYTQVSSIDVDERYHHQIQQLIDNYVPKQS